MFEVLWVARGNLAYRPCLLCRALGLQRAEMTMTANKNSSITHGAGGTKAPRETLSRWVGEHCWRRESKVGQMV
jgi:3-methyladenine DNA glycosylase Mpg